MPSLYEQSTRDDDMFVQFTCYQHFESEEKLDVSMDFDDPADLFDKIWLKVRVHQKNSVFPLTFGVFR